MVAAAKIRRICWGTLTIIEQRYLSYIWLKGQLCDMPLHLHICYRNWYWNGVLHWLLGMSGMIDRENIHWVQIERVALWSFRAYPIGILSLWVNALWLSDAIGHIKNGQYGLYKGLFPVDVVLVIFMEGHILAANMCYQWTDVEPNQVINFIFH